MDPLLRHERKERKEKGLFKAFLEEYKEKGLLKAFLEHCKKRVA
jgi:uncharacterized protein (UPF0332 family)